MTSMGSLEQPAEAGAEAPPSPSASLPRVLSIQSHVVHGYVGNKCAVFPLQILGLEVDPVCSVQFSNHAGYPSFTGTVFDGPHLEELMAGMAANGLINHTHLLTGYVGSASLLKSIASVCAQLKQATPHFTYVCDPVMGDEGRLYVKQELVDAFREDIVPLASCMVPNQYEAELLTGVAIDGLQAAAAACDHLHARGPHTVIITSMSLPGEPDSILLMASTTLEQDPEGRLQGAQRMTMRIRKIKAYFTGTGDLLAALLLAWMHHHPRDLCTAVEKAVAGLQVVLVDTAQHCGPAALAAERTSAVCAARELRLIQNQHKLRDPPIEFRCEALAGIAPPTSTPL